MNLNLISKVKQSLKLFYTICFFYLLLIPANAVLPPEYYKQYAEESKIKAVATITHVETLSIGKYSSFKKATFRLEHVFRKKRSKTMTKVYSALRKLSGNETPQVFTGLCNSVDTEEQNKNIMAGGTIYFYPYVGARVFVTVSSDGGSITTLTTLTPEMEKVIRETPEKLEFSMGGIYIKRSSDKY